VIALLALFGALSGTAVAAGVVPLAKRALSADKAKVADNARKLGGKTPAQLRASLRGARGPQGVAGPQGPQGPAGPPTDDGSGWQLFLLNASDTDAVSGTLYAVCLG
jgi:hypothetical protein